MIARKFGSYGLTIITQTPERRVSNLYSGSEALQVTRTLAVVQFSEPLAAELREPHRKILQGGSLGATLKAAGWQVGKTTLGFRSTTANARLAGMMQLAERAELAVHLYELSATRGNSKLHYAQIAEVHHPDHLTGEDLERLYGRPPSGDGSVPPTSDDPAAGLLAALADALEQLQPVMTHEARPGR